MPNLVGAADLGAWGASADHGLQGRPQELPSEARRRGGLEPQTSAAGNQAAADTFGRRDGLLRDRIADDLQSIHNSAPLQARIPQDAVVLATTASRGELPALLGPLQA